jgi:hypothetical protein
MNAEVSIKIQKRVDSSRQIIATIARIPALSTASDKIALELMRLAGGIVEDIATAKPKDEAKTKP